MSIIKNKKACGVITGLGHEIKSKAVVVTSGTFLNGIIHIGEKQLGGGRIAEKAATGITEQLVALGFESGRMKTGTPPRVDGRSLDYSKMREEPGDVNPAKFSYSDVTKPLTHQKLCHMTYTSQEVHDILREGFDRSPMFNGRIKSLGPRYCPSIEDKIKGKAAVDGICNRLGKSAGAVIYHILLLSFTSIPASAPYVGVFLLITIGLWILCVRVLGKKFNELTQPEPKASYQANINSSSGIATATA